MVVKPEVPDPARVALLERLHEIVDDMNDAALITPGPELDQLIEVLDDLDELDGKDTGRNGPAGPTG